LTAVELAVQEKEPSDSNSVTSEILMALGSGTAPQGISRVSAALAMVALARLATALWQVNAGNIIQLVMTTVGLSLQSWMIISVVAAKNQQEIGKLGEGILWLNLILLIAGVLSWLLGLIGAIGCLSAPYELQSDPLVLGFLIAESLSGLFALAVGFEAVPWWFSLPAALISVLGSFSFLLFVRKLAAFMREEQLVVRSKRVSRAALLLSLLTVFVLAGTAVYFGLVIIREHHTFVEAIMHEGGGLTTIEVAWIVVASGWLIWSWFVIDLIRDIRRVILAACSRLSITCKWTVHSPIGKA
jgi:hypothetical protein